MQIKSTSVPSSSSNASQLVSHSSANTQYNNKQLPTVYGSNNSVSTQHSSSSQSSAQSSSSSKSGVSTSSSQPVSLDIKQNPISDVQKRISYGAATAREGECCCVRCLYDTYIKFVNFTLLRVKP